MKPNEIPHSPTKQRTNLLESPLTDAQREFAAVLGRALLAAWLKESRVKPIPTQEPLIKKSPLT